MYLSPIGDSNGNKRVVVSCPVVSVFSQPTFRSETVTQEIVGRTVLVDDIKDGWLKCTLSDGYSGWIASSAVCEDQAFKPTHFVFRRFSKVSFEGANAMILPFGGFLEVNSIQRSRCLVKLPGQGIGCVSARDLKPISSLPYPFSMFGRILKEVIGATYLWGGKSTFGFDCSGLVQFIYYLLGIRLPRDSFQQAEVGEEISSMDSLKPLDLIFFASSGRVDHVAIHLGNLAILHASGFVKVESLRPGEVGFRKDLREKVACFRRLRS